MEYIYDIILNFQKEYYDFYEWLPSDKIINIKKIAIYKINTNDYLNIKNHETIINKDSLPIKNKIFLLTNGIEIMGITIDNDGKVLKKSSLLFDESDEILEDKDEIKLINIKYQIIKKHPLDNKSRVTKEKYNYIKNYLNKLDKQKDEYLLKYLYYEIFNKEEENINTIYEKLIYLLEHDLIKLYTGIKNVNLELKK